MKAVFLDRDGVINEYPGDYKYVTDWKEFHFLPGAKKAISKLSQAGYLIFVISNQAGVSKGVYPQEKLDIITKNMLSELNKAGARVDGVYYCIHREEDNCPCRKPKTGLIETALEKFGDNNLAEIDFAGSFFIGDTIRDIITGKSAGLKTILVFSGKEKPQNNASWQYIPDYTVQDLSEAANIIIGK